MKNFTQKFVITVICIMCVFSIVLKAQEKPFPDFPPFIVTNAQDRDQMLWQLHINKYTTVIRADAYKDELLPKLKSQGTDVTLKPNDPANPEGNWTWATGTSSVVSADKINTFTETRAEDGMWNNYIQSWEPGGTYFSGANMYPPLALHNLKGLTVKDWPARRQEIFNEVQKIWGTIPAEAANVKITWSVGEVTTGVESNIPYKEYTIIGNIDISSYPAVREIPRIMGTLRIPTNVGGKPVPIIINIGSGGRMPGVSTALWESFGTKGMGVFGYANTLLQPDNGAGLTSYIIGLVNKGNWRKPEDWGSLVAWSWGVSRLLDYFETNADVDAKKVGITGHSRYGKAAVVAMAYEPRLAIAAPTSSGALGVAPSRRHWGQDLSNSAGDREYHWMAGNFMAYTGVDESSKDGYMPRKVLQMKVDAESLVALCAPRPLFVGSGDYVGDAWVDPYGQYLVCVAASPVYELLGKKGLKMEDVMSYKGKNVPLPVTNKAYMDGDLAYRKHDGGHSAYQHYPSFAEFAARYFK